MFVSIDNFKSKREFIKSCLINYISDKKRIGLQNINKHFNHNIF